MTIMRSAPTRAGALVLALAALTACGATPQHGTVRGQPSSTGALAGGPVLAAFPRLQASRGLPVAESSPTGAERAFAMQLLSDLQALSFAGNREYCGYLGLDPAGRLMATPTTPGSEASCPLPRVPQGMTLLASFHTHGTYSPYYASEWPTTQDMETDASDNIDGYIATPGGRVWHVDSDTMTVTEICGRGCLPQDPAYIAADDGPLLPVMSYRQLAAWERS